MGVKIVYSLLVFTVLSSILFILTGLTMFSQQINVFVFNQKHIFSYKDKLAIAKTLCIWLGVYMFLLVTSVMLIRIYTGKFNASKGTEPTAISAINRIITNTIQQSAIFACLYGGLLLNEGTNEPAIQGDQMLALASMFVIGRMFYLVGYMIGAATDIMSFRSFGFGINVLINIVMVAYHVGFDIFGLLGQQVTPMIKSII